MLMGIWFTTSPTATSSLFFGFAIYSLFGQGFGGGLSGLGKPRDCRGARAQFDIDDVDVREGVINDLD